MTDQNSPQTETIQQQTLSLDSGVTIRNDLRSDALIFLTNAVWGAVSLGYARAGHSVTLPTSVNVDAHALLQHDAGTFVQWPGPIIAPGPRKINLTPGQTYSLSNFS
ncbi:MAG TPA: hypothetical protein VGQ76_22770 [Thermoanaerobaculia bacterium]|jgi:hypothetical protein|nr:hypothetical protein [Thermoanaerobaculia bacterium]